MRKLILSAALVCSFGFVSLVNGQCKTFTKKQCMPQLKPYIHNGQMNNITLFPGEEASLIQTFYSHQSYRIQICAQENLGDSVYFKIFTEDNQMVYSSQNESTSYWDFNVSTTQNLKITVVVPKDEAIDEIEQNGCIALLIGFKDE